MVFLGLQLGELFLFGGKNLFELASRLELLVEIFDDFLPVFCGLKP